jgi:hypothetical protein
VSSRVRIAVDGSDSRTGFEESACVPATAECAVDDVLRAAKEVEDFAEENWLVVVGHNGV